MSRPIVLSNGELHVGINKYGLVHDFYYPYVGLENHASGANTRHRVGVWASGELSWLDEAGWQVSFDYHPKTLIGRIRAENSSLGVLLEFDDAIDSSVSAFMRNIHVVNLRNEARDIRLFMHQAFAIGDGRSNTDTAQYIPENNAILHYRGRRSFIVSGLLDDKPFDQHAIGVFGIEGKEGTYRDAEDGILSGSNVEHGRVDSTIRFRMELGPLSSARVQYWIAAGTSLREALYTHKHIADTGIPYHLLETSKFWQKWLAPAGEAASNIEPVFRESFLKSVLILKSQLDKRGATMASTDSAMLNYSRDAYAYCWPRDGAYIMWPLIRMGYKDEPVRFFEFMKRGLHPNGYLMHKYRADGALGSSWHPYVQDGTTTPPIQEDETAGVLFVFAQFYQQHKDAKLLKDFYEPMVVPMANFMADYIDNTTGLPKPSYDLWEEVFLTTTYTTSLVHTALLAAADLAEIAEDSGSAVKWRAAADDIAEAAKRHLYSDERQALRKGLIVKNGEIIYNDRLDSSSFYGAFMFGLFPIDGDIISSTFRAMESRFGFSLDHPGVPRYEDDYYHRKDPSSLGNWWIITTLWIAQYYNMTNQTESAQKILDWVKDRSLESGILPEQIDPSDESFVSVAPLTWSHAEYISTLLDSI